MIESLIEKLAYESFVQKEKSLRVVLLPKNVKKLKKMEMYDVSILGNELVFDSLETKNKYIANHIYRENIETVSDQKEWFSIAVDIWKKEIRNHGGNTDKASGRLLAKVHEQHDIFEIAIMLFSDSTDNTYEYPHLLSCAIPQLKNISAKSILDLFDSPNLPQERSDSLNIILEDLKTSLQKQPEICREIHSSLETNISENTKSLYSTAILALAFTESKKTLELVFSDLKDSKKLTKLSAIWSLYRLHENNYLTKTEEVKVTNLFLNYADDSDNEIKHMSVNIMSSLMKTSDVFDEKLIELSRSDQYTLSRIAMELWLRHEEIKPKSRVCRVLPSLSGITIDNYSGISNFSNCIQTLVQVDEYKEIIIDVFSDWVINQTSDNEQDAEKEIREFEALFHQIAKNSTLLSEVITNWFLSDNRKLSIACSAMLSALWVSGLKTPIFNKEILDCLDLLDLKFLVRRMLGFLYDKDQLLSLSISILETKYAKKRVFGLLKSLFIDEIGRDFPGDLIKRLEEYKNVTGLKYTKLFCDDVINSIQKPLDTFSDLPRLTEFKPPFELQRSFRIARKKAMDRSMEEAMEGSWTRLIASEIPIKAGKGWFSYRDGEYTEPSFMHENSYSATVPRREVLDQVGSKIRRLSYRYSKRGEE